MPSCSHGGLSLARSRLKQQRKAMPEQNAEPLVPVRDEPDRIDYLPVSLLAEIVYCPRNFYYRMVEGWEDVTSAQMLKGRIEEERRAERPVVQHGDLRQVRSVAMSSE